MASSLVSIPELKSFRNVAYRSQNVNSNDQKSPDFDFQLPLTFQRSMRIAPLGRVIINPIQALRTKHPNRRHPRNIMLNIRLLNPKLHNTPTIATLSFPQPLCKTLHRLHQSQKQKHAPTLRSQGRFSRLHLGINTLSPPHTQDLLHGCSMHSYCKSIWILEVRFEINKPDSPHQKPPLTSTAI
ncbi:hypothetical protein BDZ45DRAFT_213675 [Acephala macrosclerotiorum]|nr:hypothetical protein BDZ45DRAFT_213675 [Acephala macrosclerotiorum]